LKNRLAGGQSTFLKIFDYFVSGGNLFSRVKLFTESPSPIDPKPIFAARISKGILGSTRSLVKKFLEISR
jgi:hypothetical protein